MWRSSVQIRLEALFSFKKKKAWMMPICDRPIASSWEKKENEYIHSDKLYIHIYLTFFFKMLLTNINMVGTVHFIFNFFNTIIVEFSYILHANGKYRKKNS